jgi:hypothetical protein
MKNEIFKLTEKCFLSIKNGNNHIRHGYSKNKKYLRLFQIQKNEIILLKNEKTGEIIEKLFKSIKVFEIDNKSIFEVTFE